MSEYTFDLGATDDELVQIFSEWLKESQSYHDELLKKQKVSEEYYLGNQTDKDQIPAHNSDTVINRIFETTETLVPMVTAASDDFLVTPGSESGTSVKRAEKLMKVLKKKWSELEMQRKKEDVVRDLIVLRFGVMKWYWNTDKDDIDVKVIDPRLIMIPKLRLDPHDLPYKMEILEMTREEVEKYFPGEKDNLTYTESKIDTAQRGAYKKTARVYEVWTSEICAFFANNRLLKKEANPYYDFEGEEKEYTEEYVTRQGIKDTRVKKDLVFHNHLDRPTDPYVFFTNFRISKSPIGDTSLTEIAIPIQDDINTQKRQIVNNLVRMGNGQVLLDSDAMSQEEAQNITSEPGLVIMGKGVASENKLRREAGVPLPNSHFANLQHSEMVFDNVMGTHSSTRGTADSKTLGQDIISRQQDFTRIDTLNRVMNRGMNRLANGLVQLIKMFYEEYHVIKILGEEGTVEFINLNRDDVEDYIEIDVRNGKSPQMDDLQIANQSIQLWQLGAVDPVTLLEKLGYPNPEKTVERLLAWKQGQLTMEVQAKLAEISAKVSAGSPNATVGAPKAERGVETPLNSMQRTEMNVGGTAPITGTTKEVL